MNEKNEKLKDNEMIMGSERAKSVNETKALMRANGMTRKSSRAWKNEENMKNQLMEYCTRLTRLL
jgi:hypothetical protein